METQVAIIGASIAALRAAHECSRAGVPWVMLAPGSGLGESVGSTRVSGFVLDHSVSFVTGSEAEWVAWDESILGLLGPITPHVVRFRSDGQWHEQADPLRHAVAARLGRLLGFLRTRQAPLPNEHREGVLALSRLGSQLAQESGGSEESVVEVLRRCGAASSIASVVLPLSRLCGIHPEAAGSACRLAGRWHDGLIPQAGEVASDRVRVGPALFEGGFASLIDHVAPQYPVLDVEGGGALGSGVLLQHPVDRITPRDTGLLVCSGEFELRTRVAIMATADTRGIGARHGAASQQWRTLHYSLPLRSAPAELSGGTLVVSDEAGPIHHAIMVSDLSPQCAPTGRRLLSIGVIDPTVVGLGPVGADRAVRGQLASWLGADALAGWKMVHSSTSTGPAVIGPAHPGEATLGTHSQPRIEQERVVECPPEALTGPLVEQVGAGRLAASEALTRA